MKTAPARLGLAMVAIGALARADDPARHRIVGIGSGIGGGFAAVTLTGPAGSTSTTSTTLPAFMLPTLEGQVFLTKHEWSIDLTIPLTNILVVSGVVGGFFFQADAFFNANFGRGLVRFVAGPGLGFTAVSARSVSGAAFRAPAELGIELLLADKRLGIKLLARPWVEFARGAVHTVGGGVIGLLTVSGYVTKSD